MICSGLRSFLGPPQKKTLSFLSCACISRLAGRSRRLACSEILTTAVALPPPLFEAPFFPGPLEKGWTRAPGRPFLLSASVTVFGFSASQVLERPRSGPSGVQASPTFCTFIFLLNGQFAFFFAVSLDVGPATEMGWCRCVSFDVLLPMPIGISTGIVCPFSMFPSPEVFHSSGPCFPFT